MLEKIKYLDYLVIGFLLLGTFSFLYFTGTLTSGYHFIDDHGMIGINNALVSNTYIGTALQFINNDLLIRFRPIFFIFQVSLIKALGLNYLCLSVFVGLMGFFTLAFFYLGMRKLKHSVIHSVLFVLLIFCGPQMAIWWRLGVNETIAIFFLGLSFIFLGKCTSSENYRLNNALFISFLSISALSKESFLIAVPAFVLLKLWNEKESYQISWKQALRKNVWLVIPLFTMLLGLLVIKFYVGTNQIGYAGVTSSLREFLSGIKNIILGPTSLLYWAIVISVLLGLYLLSVFSFMKKGAEPLKGSILQLTPYIIFSATLVVPEVLMHAKSGMVERYLVPATLGLAFLSVGLIRGIKIKILKYAAFLAIFVYIMLSFSISVRAAQLFAAEGRDAGYFFSTIKNNVSTSDDILLVVDPASRFEVSASIKIYLSSYGHNDFYAHPMARQNYSPFEISLEEQWNKWFVGKRLESMSGTPELILVFDKIQSETFFAQSGISQSDYINKLPIDSGHAVYKRVK